MATIQDFEQLDIRTGTITACEPFPRGPQACVQADHRLRTGRWRQAFQRTDHGSLRAGAACRAPGAGRRQLSRASRGGVPVGSAGPRRLRARRRRADRCRPSGAQRAQARLIRRCCASERSAYHEREPQPGGNHGRRQKDVLHRHRGGPGDGSGWSACPVSGQGPDDTRHHRRHDRFRQDGPVHRPHRGGPDRRGPSDCDRPQGRPRQPAPDVSGTDRRGVPAVGGSS